MLTDAEAEAIRSGLAAGVRGPVLITWCEQLLRDRAERVACERDTRDLQRVTVDALRAAVRDHGPITLERASSAAKRVVGQLCDARQPRHAFRADRNALGE
jgi:hypothetical protein